ncbi:hypothetical protein C8R44DRAFT_866954 [Mycena epipterygia]|nr:hypothetical protein C8R44DRAFT_866954 [Mycena epipterygia]
MDPQDRFAIELWLEVFAYLSQDALKALSLIHRTLFDISRPLRFVDFKFHPYPSNYRQHQPTSAQVDHALQRLRFWSSPEIAPLVRSCSITPWEQRAPASAISDTESPYIALYAFFDRLPQFTGLQQLHASEVEFTQTGMANLCGLPVLTRLHIHMCCTAAGERIDTSSLALRVSLCIARCSPEYNLFWIRLLDPHHLRELHVDYVYSLDTTTPFPHVHTLNITLISLEDAPNLAILSKFPAVRALAANKNCLGVLRAWTARTTLTHLNIIDNCCSHDLLTALQGLPASSNIIALEVTLNIDPDEPFGTAECEALVLLLPRLTVLRICMYPEVEEDGGVTPQPATFIKALIDSASLPETLESLVLAESARGYEPAPPAETPAFAGLREALTMKCPALTEIYLDGHYFLFQWRKVLLGGTVQVMEGTADNLDAIEILRRDSDAFWEDHKSAMRPPFWTTW